MCNFCSPTGLTYISSASAGSPQAGGAGPNVHATQTATGQQHIDGVLSGDRWGNLTLTYSFPTSAAIYEGDITQAQNGFAAASAQLQTAVRSVMTMLSQITNMVTTEVSASTQSDIRTAISSSPATAEAYYPANSNSAGDMWYGTGNAGFQSPVLGDYSWLTVIHELGHSLGLKHAHETGGVSNTAVQAQFDHMAYSVMSYRGYQGADTGGGYLNEQFGYATTFMMSDIAALQTMYGANFNTQSGNTTYTWSATTGEMSINGTGQGAPGGNRIFMTVWDGNGTDTYDFSNYTTNLTVSLRPGEFSITSATQIANLGNNNMAVGNIFNALQFQNDTRSLIENAIGGTGNDALVGNAAVNTLTGGAGNDTYTGDAGADVFVFNAGADTVTDFTAAGIGDRIDLRALTTLTSFAAITALGAQVGANTVFTFSAGNTLTLNNITLATLTAGDFLFNGTNVNTVTGTAGADSLTGTAGADEIDGLAGNDTINGLGGGDTIVGGDNDDTIYYYASDTWASITGGNGTDTLLIVNGSAPTSLNLTAQGFEGARHEQSDTGNTQAWATITDTYNATWQVLTSNRINDDSTRTLTTYDRGALAWNYRVEQFNAAAARTEQQTYNDDSTRNSYYWDALSAQTWREYGEDYNAAGQRTIQRIYNDDNSYRFFYWDPTNAQTWTNFDDEFNAAGQRHTERIVYDTGATRNFYWDVTSTQTWTTFDEEFTAGPGATRSIQRIQNDDGTTSQQFWDTDNSQAYSTYVDYMNAAGQRVEQRIFHDAGGYTRVYYDPTNVQPWSTQTDVYNAAGVLVTSTQVPG